jgi:hypothetical protein
MTDVKKQQICIQICFKLGKMAAETHKRLKKAFDDNALGQTHFKNGWMSVEEERSRRPSNGTTTKNVAKVREAIKD